ncbi:hypothetical protein OK016_26965 [Vibrio chagasii]|nr:hypothetical protein [Vibrio chagasii]
MVGCLFKTPLGTAMKKSQHGFPESYMTMAKMKPLNKFRHQSLGHPLTSFLQAGVGAMAGGVLGYLVDKLGAGTFRNHVLAEPAATDCIFAQVLEGEMVNVSGED